MRNLALLGFSSLLAAVGLAGCGGVETGEGSSDITGENIDVYASPSSPSTHVDTETWSSIAALVEKDGAYTTFPGSIDADGKLLIPGVPEGPYLLALTSAAPETIPGAGPYTSHFATSARKLDLGTTYSGRAEVATMTQPTFLALDATLTIPWQAYTEDGMGNVVQPLDDSLQFISRNASVVGTYIAGQSAPQMDGSPTTGASKLTWNIDASSAFAYSGDLSLIDGSKGDDLTILHDFQQQVGTYDGVDPWSGYTFQSTMEVLRPAVPTMTDGGTSAVSGAFSPVKQSSFSVDYKGSAFNALLVGVPIDYAYVDFSIVMEPGIPHPQVGAYATLLDASTFGVSVYTNPSCGGAVCDPAACPSGCDPGTYQLPGDHAHTFSYGNPFDFGQELFSVLVTLRMDVGMLLPEKSPERLRASFYVQAPASELDGKPLQPVLGLPLGIEVAGKTTPYNQITSGVGAAPVITWSAPVLGKPTSYRIVVVDLTDLTDKDGLPILRRSIASFDVTDTTLTLPTGLLQAGKFYYFQVSASTQDSSDRAAPYKLYPVHEAFAQMFTGVVTP